jgi:hypothetical protein
MTHDDPRDERLARLLAATRAEANPGVLARARARLAARERAPGLAVWLGRPEVLAGAGALFALCVAGTFAVSRQAATATATTATETSLLASVLGEDDLGLPIELNGGSGTADANGGAAGDSGGVTP